MPYIVLLKVIEGVYKVQRQQGVVPQVILALLSSYVGAIMIWGSFHKAILALLSSYVGAIMILMFPYD